MTLPGRPSRVEILSIGDELLDGRVVDTNTVRLAHGLAEVGLHLSHRSSVTDDLTDIQAEARACAARGTQLCIVSGGLGPTADDLTAAAFADLLGVPLCRDLAYAAALRQRLEARGKVVTDNQLKQADRPQGATLLANPVGTAPGFTVELAGCRFVALPGVPREFDAMLADHILAPLRHLATPVARRGLYCFGLMEAEVDARLAPLSARWPQVRLQFRVKFPEVHVTMHAAASAETALCEAFSWAQTQLGHHVFSVDAEVGFAASILAALRARGATLACAESSTGGLVADQLTDVAGCSDVLLLGIVAYSNAAKVGLLGVDPGQIAAHGAVSETVVREMAAGARRQGKSDYAIATSGVAGPNGGSEAKPVGLLCMAVAGPEGTVAQTVHLSLDRRGNKTMGAYCVLNLLRQQLARAEGPLQ